MNGTWLRRIRTLHTWLGVFFSPLLLLFIITGWWQTFATDESKDHGWFNKMLSKFSSIHTDDYFAHTGGHSHGSEHFKIFVGLMAAMLIVTILLGLILAAQKWRLRWTALALLLGVLVPALILYFN